MKNIVISEVKSRRELNRFIAFPNKLFKGVPTYVPPLNRDERALLTDKNPSLEHCNLQMYLATVDGKIVGRVAAIINHTVNEHWNKKAVRFGWFDFIDDLEVSRALLDTVAAWGKARGMDGLNGPCGFTDFDHEGLLIEGYEFPAVMASLYNYPYYVQHIDAYGLTKEADWIELQVFPPKACPERIERICQIVKERFNVHVVKVKNSRELVKRFGIEYMDVIDEAYQKLYNFQPMTDKQKNYYKDMYFQFLNFDFVTLVVNENEELVGVGLGMPDISPALRKCGGKLLPFGWYHLIKALKAKQMESFSFLLIAVRPDYQDKGINALFLQDQIPIINQYGIRKLETTSMLETNTKVLSFFRQFDHKQHKRHRAYIKRLED